MISLASIAASRCAMFLPMRSGARKAAEPPKDPEAARLKAYKTRLSKQQADLEAKLAFGDFSKLAPRTPLVLDPDAQRLKADVGRTKNQIDQEIEKLRLSQRTQTAKVLDMAVKWQRATLLSGMQTLGKLTTAGAMRNVMTPIEEVVGSGLSKVPGLNRVAAKAPREGGASMKAEARAAASLWRNYTEVFKPGAKSEAGQVLRTGKASIDVLYGKKGGNDLPPEAIEMFGRIHGALKTPTKLAEFERSLTKRLEWAGRNGEDISDPGVQATHAAGAYADANRAIASHWRRPRTIRGSP